MWHKHQNIAAYFTLCKKFECRGRHAFIKGNKDFECTMFFRDFTQVIGLLCYNTNQCIVDNNMMRNRDCDSNTSWSKTNYLLEFLLI